MADKLNERQQRFVDNYIITANATKAAKLAGYSANTAGSIGEENLRKPKIREAIDARLNEMEEQRVAKAEEVMIFLTDVLRGNFKEELATPSGKVVQVQIPAAQRIKAAEHLLKVYGKFKEKVEVEMSGAELLTQTLEKVWENQEQKKTPHLSDA